MVMAAFGFGTGAAGMAAVFERGREIPVLSVVIGCALALGLALPITVGARFSQSLRPIRDLSEGTERVAAGDYTRRLPVVQDDDLGTLAASFNRRQAGLAERQRLHTAFGTYVDPVLAARLLEQGDDVFTGERRTVTVMFVDVRDFTPFAEANTAEDTVARLNALFGIVVPAVVDAGGHVNKFLGDGALAVFGAQRPRGACRRRGERRDINSPPCRRAIWWGSSDRHRDQHRCGDCRNHRRRRQARVHAHR
jgi:adenylate cyclase